MKCQSVWIFFVWILFVQHQVLASQQFVELSSSVDKKYHDVLKMATDEDEDVRSVIRFVLVILTNMLMADKGETTASWIAIAGILGHMQDEYEQLIADIVADILGGDGLGALLDTTDVGSFWEGGLDKTSNLCMLDMTTTRTLYVGELDNISGLEDEYENVSRTLKDLENFTKSREICNVTLFPSEAYAERLFRIVTDFNEIFHVHDYEMVEAAEDFAQLLKAVERYKTYQTNFYATFHGCETKRAVWETAYSDLIGHYEFSCPVNPAYGVPINSTKHNIYNASVDANRKGYWEYFEAKHDAAEHEKAVFQMVWTEVNRAMCILWGVSVARMATVNSTTLVLEPGLWGHGNGSNISRGPSVADPCNSEADCIVWDFCNGQAAIEGDPNFDGDVVIGDYFTWTINDQRCAAQVHAGTCTGTHCPYDQTLGAYISPCDTPDSFHELYYEPPIFDSWWTPAYLSCSRLETHLDHAYPGVAPESPNSVSSRPPHYQTWVRKVAYTFSVTTGRKVDDVFIMSKNGFCLQGGGASTGWAFAECINRADFRFNWTNTVLTSLHDEMTMTGVAWDMGKILKVDHDPNTVETNLGELGAVSMTMHNCLNFNLVSIRCDDAAFNVNEAASVFSVVHSLRGQVICLDAPGTSACTAPAFYYGHNEYNFTDRNQTAPWYFSNAAGEDIVPFYDNHTAR